GLAFKAHPDSQSLRRAHLDRDGAERQAPDLSIGDRQKARKLLRRGERASKLYIAENSRIKRGNFRTLVATRTVANTLNPTERVQRRAIQFSATHTSDAENGYRRKFA